MPTIVSSVSVAANALSTNVLAGELYEFLPAHAVINLYATGSATGLRCSFIVGGETILDDTGISEQNRVPVIPDDLLVTDGGRAGERLVLRFRNTTAGALTARWIVQIAPVG